MQVYLRDGSAQTTLRAATLRQKLQTKFSVLPSHSILMDTRPTSTSTDPITPGAQQRGHRITIFISHWYDSKL